MCTIIPKLLRFIKDSDMWKYFFGISGINFHNLDKKVIGSYFFTATFQKI